MTVSVYPQTTNLHADNLVIIKYFPRFSNWGPNYFFVVGHEYDYENMIIPGGIDKGTELINLLESTDFMIIFLNEINKLKRGFKKKQKQMDKVLKKLI